MTKQQGKDASSNPIEKFKSIWTLPAFLLSIVVAIAEFIQLWRGDRNTVTLIVSGVSLAVLLLVLGYVAFSTTISTVYTPRPSKHSRYPRLYKYARGLMILVVLVTFGTGIVLFQRDLALQNEIIVVVANFDGPDPEQYRVTEQLLSQLEVELRDYSDTKLVALDEIITQQEGATRARDLGARHRADLVIWGWYGVTGSDVLLTTHLENLNSSTLVSVEASGVSAAKAPRADIEGFQIQQRLSDEMSALILYVIGARFDSKQKTTLKPFAVCLLRCDWVNGLKILLPKQMR